jgi:hypothetical protein
MYSQNNNNHLKLCKFHTLAIVSSRLNMLTLSILSEYAQEPVINPALQLRLPDIIQLVNRLITYKLDAVVDPVNMLLI